MATKLELIAALENAGFDGYSMTDAKEDLEAAVAAIDPVIDRRRGI
jgi:hypothetical protein